MSRIYFTTSGSFKNMERFLKSMGTLNIRKIVEPLAQQGVEALRQATPKDSGLTAESWDYEIEGSYRFITITWTNSNNKNGFPVAIMLQYGYGTGTGGYVQGRDFINPALKPIFDNIAEGVWKVVTSA